MTVSLLPASKSLVLFWALMVLFLFLALALSLGSLLISLHVADRPPSPALIAVSFHRKCLVVKIIRWHREITNLPISITAISPIISKVFEYYFWTDWGHYFLRRIISLVLKKTPVVGMRYTLFVRSSTAMLLEVGLQLPTFVRSTYLRLLIK